MKTMRFLLLLVSCVLMSEVSAIKITGVVRDDAGGAMPGVNVAVKGTTTGAITDFDGKYSINANVNDVLVFSFIGFQIQELVVKKGVAKLNVVMQAVPSNLDEVVVIGYATEKKQIVTSSSVSGVSTAPVSARTSYADPGMRRKLKKEKCIGRDDTSNESYAKIDESGFKKVTLNPLSTFSIDVDVASYGNLRRYINGGSLPPADAVRVEEMINYFNYDYPQPRGDNPFSINAEYSICPWNKENYLLHVGLKGKEIEMSELPASNIVFLLDVSGSMSSENKLPLLKSSLKLLIRKLRPEDRVAIVVYAGSSGLVLPSTSCENKKAIVDALEKLNAGGSTAGGAGIKLAYKVAEENFIKGGNNRIILATDGDFNVGQSSNSEMERLIEKKREKGVFISVLGFGMGNYKDDKMEIIADKGNGNYAYIDNIREAKKVLVNEFGGTLFTIAKDVKFQLEFNPAHVAEYRLIGYQNRLLNDEDFEDDKKDAGELGAGHTVTALYEIVPNRGGETEQRLKYQNSRLSKKGKSNELVTLKLRYKKPDGKKSKLLEQVVSNKAMDLSETSENYRYSAAVAQFGMLIRKEKQNPDATWKSAIQLARSAKGSDVEGYRSEMIQLMKTAAMISDGVALE